MSARLAAYVPAAVGLALLVVVTELRMGGPWANGVLALVALVPASLLCNAGLLAARGTLTWMLAAFMFLAAAFGRRAGSAACLLLASLAGVALLLEIANWVFGADDADTFRVLLTLSFVVLYVAGRRTSGRDGVILVAASGVTVLAFAVGIDPGVAFWFGLTGEMPWGWELVILLEGAALLAYAVQRLEPGPGYLAFFVLVLFATAAATVGEATLLGWPLALAIGTAAAAAIGHSRA
jgi:hypothetical protein